MHHRFPTVAGALEVVHAPVMHRLMHRLVDEVQMGAVIIPTAADLALAGDNAIRLHLIDEDQTRAPHVAAGGSSWKMTQAERDDRNRRFKLKRAEGVSAKDIGAVFGVHAATVRRNW
jgi:hypothetical protein